MDAKVVTKILGEDRLPGEVSVPEPVPEPAPPKRENEP